MKREDLANEIRGAGNAVRFADGPVIGGTWENGKFVAMLSPTESAEEAGTRRSR